MKNLEKRKLILALLAGYSSLFLTKFSLCIDRAYDVYFMPGIVVPIIIAMLYGGKYAFLCCTLGLSMFQPFLIANYNGWGNLAASLGILIWSVGHGICMDERRRNQTPFPIQYLYQLVFILIFLIVNKPLIQMLVKWNKYFPVKSYSYLPVNIINANGIILLEIMTLCVLAVNMLIMMPVVKRYLGEKTAVYDNYSYMVIGITILGVTLTAVSASNYINELFCITVSVNDYQSNIGSTQLMLLKAVFILLVGDVILHFIHFYCKKQSYQLEMSKIQEAVFESSNDMIWSINGVTGEIQTANHVARDFFQRKNPNYQSVPFIKIFDKEEVDFWCDVMDKVAETEDYQTEYYNKDNKHYYDLQMHYIDLGNRQYDMAVFAKDITDEILLNEQIQEMNDELENRVLERTKEIQNAYKSSEHFGYTVAHELKAPLRAIGLYCNVIMEQGKDVLPAEAKEAAEKIDCYSVKLVNLVNEILNYTKLKNKKFKIVRIRMNKLIQSNVEEFRVLNPNQKIELVSDSLPDVMADEMMLNCCIHNIISNAVKFSSKKEKTTIHITWEENEKEYIFHIADNGVGFDMKESGKLFQLFGRMHADSEYEGNGIGLVTVKNIIEKHGGRFFLEAELEKGCTVTFSLPK